MSIRITQVDAFTSTPFGGNPAGVCLLDELRDEEWMQHIAQEMNLSETAFLVRKGEAFHLRWFTPGGEVDLCGHATLASAHVLWEEGHLETSETAKFDTLSGRLEAKKIENWIEMDFPDESPHECEAHPILIESLGVTPVWTARNRLDDFAVLSSEEEVRTLKPDFTKMKGLGMRGVIVTAEAENSEDYDFVSRYFAPLFGIDEDPVTGSAHCGLGPYWAKRLNKREVIGYQASSRGGIVQVRPEGERVILRGQAVTTMHISLTEAAAAIELARM